MESGLNFSCFAFSVTTPTSASANPAGASASISRVNFTMAAPVVRSCAITQPLPLLLGPVGNLSGHADAILVEDNTKATWADRDARAFLTPRQTCRTSATPYLCMTVLSNTHASRARSVRSGRYPSLNRVRFAPEVDSR